jgi:hypothetical protein
MIFIPGSGSAVTATGVLDETAKEAASGTLTQHHRRHTWVVIDGSEEKSRSGNWKVPCPAWVHTLVASLAEQAKSENLRVNLVGFSRGSFWVADLIAKEAGSTAVAKALLIAPYFYEHVSPLRPDHVVLGASRTGCQLALAASMADATTCWNEQNHNVMQLAAAARWAAIYGEASHQYLREAFLVGLATDADAASATFHFLYDTALVPVPVTPMHRSWWYCNGTPVTKSNFIVTPG